MWHTKVIWRHLLCLLLVLLPPGIPCNSSSVWRRRLSWAYATGRAQYSQTTKPPIMKGLIHNISATLNICKSDHSVTGCWALKNEGLYTYERIFWKARFINLLWLSLVWHWDIAIERKISIWINICLHSLTNDCVVERFIFLSYKLINMEKKEIARFIAPVMLLLTAVHILCWTGTIFGSKIFPRRVRNHLLPVLGQYSSECLMSTIQETHKDYHVNLSPDHH